MDHKQKNGGEIHVREADWDLKESEGTDGEELS